MPATALSPPESRPADAAPHPGDAREHELIARICRRERLAFEALYRLYHPRLTRFLQRMLRPTHLVEEVLDDALYVVWSHPERFDGSSRVSTWIFAIAYRKALKALSRHDEPQEWQDDDEPMRAGHDQLSADVPEDRLGHAQLQRALRQAMSTLSVEQRAAVELTYFHGFSYPEIAAVVDCPVDTVKTRMFHARRRLKAALGGRSGDWL